MAEPSRFPWGKGALSYTRDATTNDSDKSFTVPTGKIWRVLSVESTLMTDATVGNRALTIQFYNGTPALVWGGKATASVAASNNGGAYAAVGATESTTARGRIDGAANSNHNAQSVMNIPWGLVLLAGYSIRVWDVNAVAVNGDDLTVVIHYIEYDA